jgi:hypothetical protein
VRRAPLAGHRHAIGLTRRELLQVGYSGLLGIGVPSILAGQAAAGTASKANKAKSVVLIFLTGAPSHLDTFDLKPQAPVEIRGDFKAIATKAAGVHYCEHLPGLAARANKLAVIRSMTHGLPSHEHATHMMLTGIDLLPPGSTHMASRSEKSMARPAQSIARDRTARSQAFKTKPSRC